MNSTLLSMFAAIVAVTLAACGGVGEAPGAKTGDSVQVTQAAGGSYVIDTSRSKIAWKAAKVSMGAVL